MIGAPPLYDPARLGQALASRSLDALLVASPTNVRYLTRFGKPGGTAALVTAAAPRRTRLALPSPSADFLVEDLAAGVEPQAYGEFFRMRSPGSELTPAEELVSAVGERSRRDADLPALVAEIVGDAGLSGATIGADRDARLLGGCADSIGGAELVGADGLIRELRSRKTPVELEYLRAAAAVAEGAIQATIEAVREGATQRELAARFAGAVVADSAQVRMANVSLGRSSALGNANVADDVLEPGDVIRFDVGAIVGGYESDLSRCFTLGAPRDPRVEGAYAALAAGQAAALAEVRAGAPASDVFEVGLDATRNAGLPDYQRTNLGHGIGLHGDGYDAPLIAPDDHTPLGDGAVICVETPYYELGLCGLQVEDMVLVTESGYEPLTHLDRGLAAV